MKKITFGLLGEYIAIIIYKVKLYQILYHQKRYYTGEIDIVALRGHQIVFIEVKSRRSHDNNVLSIKQQIRIKNSAKAFLSYNPKYQNYDVRFDLVIIRPYTFPTIIENAW
jgi:putative endonuclease